MDGLARELKRVREEAGMSQTELAKVSGVHRVNITKFEAGRQSPSVPTLEKLARAMNVEVGDFFPKAEPALFDSPPALFAAPEVLKVVRELASRPQPEIRERLEGLERAELRKLIEAAHHEKMALVERRKAELEAGRRLVESDRRVLDAFRVEVALMGALGLPMTEVREMLAHA